jgi:NAD(P)H-dependent nitrite reductase small subunit
VAERRFKVARLQELPRSGGKVVKAGGTLIALFNVQGELYAIDNECPHSGGPLAEGDLQGTTVRCPWHLWQYDVTSGRCLSNPFGDVRSYPVEVADGEVWVTIRRE